MANKKPRAPMPPPVQAPKRRDTSAASNPLAEVPRWVWFASAGVIAGAVIILVLLGQSKNKSSVLDTSGVKAAMLNAGCTYRDVAPLPPKKDPTGQNGGYHQDVPTLTTSTKGLWSTSPPSGGAHYPQWAIWGFYTTPSIRVRSSTTRSTAE